MLQLSSQRPVTRSFDVFFDLRLNKRLGKQSWGWWSETPSRSLWRHCNVQCGAYGRYGWLINECLAEAKKAMLATNYFSMLLTNNTTPVCIVSMYYTMCDHNMYGPIGKEFLCLHFRKETSIAQCNCNPSGFFIISVHVFHPFPFWSISCVSNKYNIKHTKL